MCFPKEAHVVQLLGQGKTLCYQLTCPLELCVRKINAPQAHEEFEFLLGTLRRIGEGLE